MSQSREASKDRKQDNSKCPLTTGGASMADSTKGKGSSAQDSEDWSKITDPELRRRVQNRISQRNYRVRKRTEQEQQALIAENQEAAGAAYKPPEAEDLARNDNPEGLPWGSYSIKYSIEASKAKAAQSQAQSREGSVTASSSTGGASNRGGYGR